MVAKKLSNAERAEVLVQALPHIQKYSNQVVVVKYGGNAMVNEELKHQVMMDVVLLWLIGVKVVLVHGGGPEMNELTQKLGKKPKFTGGLRVTDEETIDIAEMVLAGKINKNLVSLLHVHGGSAMGVSGLDGQMIIAKQKNEELGFVGEIVDTNIKVVTDILENGYIPVISTLGCDAEGNVYNINGDTAAAYIAGALNAKRMIMLTDIAGIMRDKDDPDSLISEISIGEALDLCNDGTIAGGMIPKVDSCIKALEMGVENCVIMDGCVPHAILMELLTPEGAGTLIRKGGRL